MTACRAWTVSLVTMPTCEPWTCPTTVWRACPTPCHAPCGISGQRGTIYAWWTKTTRLITGTWKSWIYRTTSWREWSSSTTHCRVSKFSTSVTTGSGLCPQICRTAWRALICLIITLVRSFLDRWIGCPGWLTSICMRIALPGCLKGSLTSWRCWRW